jgi:acyl-CoA thioester hydrolase
MQTTGTSRIVPPHKLKIRVYYEDTDAGGIVYHARYLAFAERGRTEMLREAGYAHAQIFREKGIAFAVVSMKIDYKAPARLDDLLTLESLVVRVGGASMEIQQDIYRDGQLLTEIRVTLVCIDSGFKAVRVPAEIRRIYELQGA